MDERTLEQRWASINWNADNEDQPDAPAPEDPIIRKVRRGQSRQD